MTASPAPLTTPHPAQLTASNEQAFYDNIGRVRAVARAVLARVPTHFAENEGEDLHMIGLTALWTAAQKFDPANSAGASLWSYAQGRVRGAMIDELRKRDFIPRRTRTRIRQVKARMEEMEVELCRHVSREEAALALGFSPNEVREIVNAGEVSFTSLNKEREDGESESGSLQDVIGDDRILHPSAHMDDEGDGITLEACLDRLTEVERSIVRLYYFNGLQLAVIASCLGLTESRTCQILDASMAKLRKFMSRKAE